MKQPRCEKCNDTGYLDTGQGSVECWCCYKGLNLWRERGGDTLRKWRKEHTLDGKDDPFEAYYDQPWEE